jgi:uncharacterized protein (DUF488 family)
VDLLVDVRSIPRSRTNPQFNADALPEVLADAGIGYLHLPALGGLRHRTKGAMPSPNSLWRVAAFRNYADYAATGAFRRGLDELRALARDNCCAIMCSEAVWWRCHRRIIADYLLAVGVPVAHIMGHNKSWDTTRSTRRSSRLACNRCLAGRSCIPRRRRRSKQYADPALAHLDRRVGPRGAQRIGQWRCRPLEVVFAWTK